MAFLGSFETAASAAFNGYTAAKWLYTTIRKTRQAHITWETTREDFLTTTKAKIDQLCDIVANLTTTKDATTLAHNKATINALKALKASLEEDAAKIKRAIGDKPPKGPKDRLEFVLWDDSNTRDLLSQAEAHAAELLSWFPILHLLNSIAHKKEPSPVSELILDVLQCDSESEQLSSLPQHIYITTAEYKPPREPKRKITVLAEIFHAPRTNTDDQKTAALRSIATLLISGISNNSGGDATGLLPCLGYQTRMIEDTDTKTKGEPKTKLERALMFWLPRNTATPKTLRETIKDDRNKTTSAPLEQRFDLARQLAEIVFSLHAARVMHKNIRSHTIFLLKSESSTTTNTNLQRPVGGEDTQNQPSTSKTQVETAAQINDEAIKKVDNEQAGQITTVKKGALDEEKEKESSVREKKPSRRRSFSGSRRKGSSTSDDQTDKEHGEHSVPAKSGTLDIGSKTVSSISQPPKKPDIKRRPSYKKLAGYVGLGKKETEKDAEHGGSTAKKSQRSRSSPPDSRTGVSGHAVGDIGHRGQSDSLLTTSAATTTPANITAGAYCVEEQLLVPGNTTAILTHWSDAKKVGDTATTTGPSRDNWSAKVYRHPSQQSEKRNDDYNFGHDIYSLGVCLLEVGLWQCASYKWKDDESVGQDDQGSRKYFQEYLIGKANSLLRTTMGTAYSNIVVNCLSALEDGFKDVAGKKFNFGDDIQEVRPNKKANPDGEAKSSKEAEACFLFEKAVLGPLRRVNLGV